jgi:hypothetical protein
VCRLSLERMVVVIAVVTSGNAYAGGAYHHSDPEFLVAKKPTAAVRHFHHDPSHRGLPIQQRRVPTKGSRQ